MKEILNLLEKLGIQLLEDAEPALIKDGVQNGLDFLNQCLAKKQEDLKELKVIQHMSTIGHGLIKVDIEVTICEGCIDALAAAIKVLFDYQTTEIKE